MYEEYKFDKIEKIVLYAIAEVRKPVNKEEIYKSLEDIKPSLIDSTLRKLRREKLIILKLSNFFINTNKGAMDTTKNLLKEHWETNWEEEWKNVTAKTKVLGN